MGDVTGQDAMNLTHADRVVSEIVVVIDVSVNHCLPDM